MNDKHFEDIVRKELENFEIQPSEGLFEKVIAARSSRSSIPTAFINTKSIVILASSLFLATSWIYINSSSKNEIHNIEFAHVDDIKVLESDNEHTIDFKSSNSSKANDVKYRNETPNRINQSSESIENSIKYTSTSEKETKSAALKSQINSGIAFENNNSSSGNLINSENQMAEFVNTYPLTFKPLGEIVESFVLNQSSFDYDFFKANQSDFIPVEYKKPKSIKNSCFSNIEILVGAGTWSLPNSIYSEGYKEISPFALNANLRTRFKINNNFSILTGLSISNRSASYSYNKSESKEVMQIDTVQGFIIDPGAPPIPVTTFDTSYSNVTSNYSGNGKNNYLQLSLPIGLEFNKKYNRNLFFVNGGLLINIHSSSKGAWLPQESNQIMNFYGKSKQTASSISTGYFAGIGYGYIINSNFTWVVEGNMNLWNLSNNPIGTQANHYLITSGISTGFRWQF